MFSANCISTTYSSFIQKHFRSARSLTTSQVGQVRQLSQFPEHISAASWKPKGDQGGRNKNVPFELSQSYTPNWGEKKVSMNYCMLSSLLSKNRDLNILFMWKLNIPLPCKKSDWNQILVSAKNNKISHSRSSMEVKKVILIWVQLKLFEGGHWHGLWQVAEWMWTGDLEKESGGRLLALRGINRATPNEVTCVVQIVYRHQMNY